MKRYSIADARANLPTIVDEVEAGGEVELTRRGKPIAMVISRRLYDRLRPHRSAFAARYRAFLDRYPLDEIGVEPDFAEGLRDRGPGRDVAL